MAADRIHLTLTINQLRDIAIANAISPGSQVRLLDEWVEVKSPTFGTTVVQKSADDGLTVGVNAVKELVRIAKENPAFTAAAMERVAAIARTCVRNTRLLSSIEGQMLAYSFENKEAAATVVREMTALNNSDSYLRECLHKTAVRLGVAAAEEKTSSAPAAIPATATAAPVADGLRQYMISFTGTTYGAFQEAVRDTFAADGASRQFDARRNIGMTIVVRATPETIGKLTGTFSFIQAREDNTDYEAIAAKARADKFENLLEDADNAMRLARDARQAALRSPEKPSWEFSADTKLATAIFKQAALEKYAAVNGFDLEEARTREDRRNNVLSALAFMPHPV
jgi:hypothetical protein